MTRNRNTGERMSTYARKPGRRVGAAARLAAALEQARAWVLRHGPEGLTPALVARLSGRSRTWVSRHLGARDAILETLARDMAGPFLADLEALERRVDVTPLVRLRLVIRAMLPPSADAAHRHTLVLLEEAGLMWRGPTFYALAWALQPWAGTDDAAACAGALVGILQHSLDSPRPWSRQVMGRRLWAAAQGFRAGASRGFEV